MGIRQLPAQISRRDTETCVTSPASSSAPPRPSAAPPRRPSCAGPYLRRSVFGALSMAYSRRGRRGARRRKIRPPPRRPTGAPADRRRPQAPPSAAAGSRRAVAPPPRTRLANRPKLRGFLPTRKPRRFAGTPWWRTQSSRTSLRRPKFSDNANPFAVNVLFWGVQNGGFLRFS